MSKREVPQSYVVRRGGADVARRYRIRRTLRRNVSELGLVARTAVTAAGIALPAAPVAVFSASGSVVLAAVCAVQVAIAAWVWLRGRGHVAFKLMWSFVLAVPALGALFFLAWYDPPPAEGEGGFDETYRQHRARWGGGR